MEQQLKESKAKIEQLEATVLILQNEVASLKYV